MGWVKILSLHWRCFQPWFNHPPSCILVHWPWTQTDATGSWISDQGSWAAFRVLFWEPLLHYDAHAPVGNRQETRLHNSLDDDYEHQYTGDTASTSTVLKVMPHDDWKWAGANNQALDPFDTQQNCHGQERCPDHGQWRVKERAFSKKCWGRLCCRNKRDIRLQYWRGRQESLLCHVWRRWNFPEDAAKPLCCRGNECRRVFPHLI